MTPETSYRQGAIDAAQRREMDGRGNEHYRNGYQEFNINLQRELKAVISYGEPRTADGAVVTVGQPVFVLWDISEEGSTSKKWAIREHTVQSMDFINGAWAFKLGRYLYGSSVLYSTRLAAMAQAVSLYRGEINAIEDKISELLGPKGN